MSNSIELGSSRMKLNLTTSSWPAAVALCGTVLVLVGVFFLLPQSAQKVYRNGLSKIGAFVERVVESKGHSAAVVISEADDSKAVSIVRKGQAISLFVVLHTSMNAKMDRFSLKHAMKPIEGVSSLTKGTRDDLCRFAFTLGVDPKINTELLQALFSDVFGVGSSTALTFTEIDL